jgi:hypothetical protein
MNGFCSQNQVSRSTVYSVKAPEHTRSHKPVGYQQAIEVLETQIERSGMAIESENFGLNKAGDQMFARFGIDSGETDRQLSIGLRQSYNKTLALGVVAGANVFVCDNLMFQGSDFRVMRKNTVNVFADFRFLVQTHISEAWAGYQSITQEVDGWKTKTIDLDRGYEIIGLAQGHKALTPNQASVAYQDWKTPRHAEFSDRNVHSLYQCFTEGLKKGPAGTTAERHIVAHDFMRALAA